MNQTPPEDLPIPHYKDLYTISYDPGVLLHKDTMSRWYRDTSDNLLIRDLSGEKEWAIMGSYVGKTYAQVFLDAYLRSDPVRIKDY